MSTVNSSDEFALMPDHTATDGSLHPAFSANSAPLSLPVELTPESSVSFNNSTLTEHVSAQAKGHSCPTHDSDADRRKGTLVERERRQIMAPDTAYFYLRHLELKLQQPELFKICNSICTIDRLITDGNSGDRSLGKFSIPAWSKIRDKLFHFLLLNFEGRFVVYSNRSSAPVSYSDDFPASGFIEFFPDKEARTSVCYKQELERLEPMILQTLKSRFSKWKSKIRPDHFPLEEPKPSREAVSLLHRFYEICEEEAEKGRAKAQTLWLDLESEAKRCIDRRRRKELQKRMNRLQTVWGPPKHRL